MLLNTRVSLGYEQLTQGIVRGSAGLVGLMPCVGVVAVTVAPTVGVSVAAGVAETLGVGVAVGVGASVAAAVGAGVAVASGALLFAGLL